MEVGVVVSFLNFFTDAEEEDLEEVLAELQDAGLNNYQIDQMFKDLIKLIKHNSSIEYPDT